MSQAEQRGVGREQRFSPLQNDSPCLFEVSGVGML